MLVVLSLVLFVSSAFAQAPKDVFAKNGMVSAANELASKAGVEILKKGGNAVDAAVATALALNVVEFNASGIGGGGFMTIRFAKTGEVVALDYREMAPASATKDMLPQSNRRRGSGASTEEKQWLFPDGLPECTTPLKNTAQ